MPIAFSSRQRLEQQHKNTLNATELMYNRACEALLGDARQMEGMLWEKIPADWVCMGIRRHLRPGSVRRSLAESVVGKSRMSPLTPCGAPKLPSSRRSSALTALLGLEPSGESGRLLSGLMLLPPLLLLLLGSEWVACVSALLPFAAANAGTPWSASGLPAAHKMMFKCT